MAGSPRGAALALALVALVVVSATAPFLVVGSASAQGGFVNVPDSNIRDKIPAHAYDKIPTAAAFKGSTMASAHSSTLELTVAARNARQPSAELILNFTDDTHDAGRRVAIPLEPVRESLGYVPSMARVTNSETGESTLKPIETTGSMIYLEFAHFSTNSVEFGGTVEVSANAGVDGSAYQYDVSALDSVSDPSVTFTGATATEWDNASAASLGNGDTLALDVAGNAEPTGPSANGEPVVEITGQGATAEHNPVHDQGDGTADENGRYTFGDDTNNNPRSAEFQFTPSSSGTLQDVSVNISLAKGSGYSTAIDVYIVQEGTDTTQGEGTLVKTGWDADWTTGYQTLTLDSGYDLTQGTTYTIEFVGTTSDGDGNNDALQVAADTSSSSYTFTVDVQKQWWADMDLGMSAPTEDPAVDVNGDGVADVAHSGTLATGSTVTKEIANLSTADDTATVSTTAGKVDVAVKLRERVETVDPALEVNGGNWLNHTGRLSDGTSATASGSSAWLVSGTNRLNLTVGDGTLTADAPTPAADFTFTHDAADNKSVAYAANKWLERYNVSHTFGSDRSVANLTIPFDSSAVVAISTLETRTNGGSWSSVGSSSYDLTGTTLTVDLGPVSAGDTVEVRANGTKVSTYQADITVTDPTMLGSDLQTTFRVDSWGTGSYIGVGGTPDGTRLHYTFNESWSAAEYLIDEASGAQKIYLPNVGNGDTATVATVPVGTNPVTGEVKIQVEDPSAAKPVLDVDPGAHANDDVEYVYYNTVSGTRYVLYSQTRDVVVAHDTANSPAYFDWGDDDEKVAIFAEASGSSSGGGGGGGGGPLGSSAGGLFGPVPVSLVGALVGLGGLALLANRVFDSEVFVLGTVGAGAVIALVVVGEVASPFSTVLLIFEPVGEGLGKVANLAGIAAVALGGWYVYANYIGGGN